MLLPAYSLHLYDGFEKHSPCIPGKLLRAKRGSEKVFEMLWKMIGFLEPTRAAAKKIILNTGTSCDVCASFVDVQSNGSLLI